MRRVLAAPVLVILSVVLLAGAAALAFWPRTAVGLPLPLDDGDHEVAWLYPATNAAAWERFVAAVMRAAEAVDGESGLELHLDRAFPVQSAAVAEVAVTLPGPAAAGSARPGRLVFRWYKLTSERPAAAWVRALCSGPRRPPLAILGGSSTDGAVELAAALAHQAATGMAGPPPVLVLTTATADQQRLPDGSPGPTLTSLYPGRTFRFCFTNRQMAEAVTRFVWARPELRPGGDGIYQVMWLDDAYSVDLTERFSDALQGRLTALAAAQQVGWLTGLAASGDMAVPLGLAVSGHFTLPVAERVDFSIGGFDQPNRWEAPVVRSLSDAWAARGPGLGRPILVAAAPASGPARRLLHGLARTAPLDCARFTVLMGDALAFNTVCRDRDVAWPVQELPFDLVFFCHRNPVDERAGFPARLASGVDAPQPTGTEDVLLYGDIVQALVRAAAAAAAAAQEGDVPLVGDEIARRLRAARWHEGRVVFDGDSPLLFDERGNRRGGTGGHLVWLRPRREDARVLPHATLEVWEEQAGPDRRSWRQQRVLDLDYDDPGGGPAPLPPPREAP